MGLLFSCASPRDKYAKKIVELQEEINMLRTENALLREKLETRRALLQTLSNELENDQT